MNKVEDKKSFEKLEEIPNLDRVFQTATSSNGKKVNIVFEILKGKIFTIIMSLIFYLIQALPVYVIPIITSLVIDDKIRRQNSRYENGEIAEYGN